MKFNASDCFSAGTFEFDFTCTKMPASDAKPLAKHLLQRVMSNLIIALRPSVNMHIKEILQMLRRYNYSSLQVPLKLAAAFIASFICGCRS
jgi:hypothetical protein